MIKSLSIAISDHHLVSANITEINAISGTEDLMKDTIEGTLEIIGIKGIDLETIADLIQ